MSKVFKGFRKGIKSIWKGIKKIFKKITSSTIGKIALGAVAIYTGGVLLGAWGSTGPLASLHGAWAGGATAGSEIVATGETTSLAGTTGLAAPAAETAGAAGTTAAATESALVPAAEAANVVGAGGAASPVAGTAAGTTGAEAVLAPSGLTPEAAKLSGEIAAQAGAAVDSAVAAGTLPGTVQPSFLSKVMSGMRDTAARPFKEGGVLGKGGWAQRNPLLAAMTFQGVQGMLSPDEEDILEMRRRERERSYRGNENLRINVRPRRGG